MATDVRLVRTTVIGATLLFLGLTAAPACSQSVTIDQTLYSLADDPRADVLNAVYCPV
jgi:hypothetical protein